MHVITIVRTERLRVRSVVMIFFTFTCLDLGDLGSGF